MLHVGCNLKRHNVERVVEDVNYGGSADAFGSSLVVGRNSLAASQVNLAIGGGGGRKDALKPNQGKHARWGKA